MSQDRENIICNESNNNNYDMIKLLKIINTGIKKTKNDYTSIDPQKIQENNKYLFEFVKCSLEHINKKNHITKHK